MPEVTPTGAVDTVQRQIRRVRRQRNLHELQRTLYLLIAALASAGTLLLLLALFAGTRLFAVAAWSIGAALPVTLVLAARETARRWLSRRQAVTWIDERGALAGRLRTLVELPRRDEHGEPFMVPLLRAQTLARLDAWHPRRLVPRRVPRGALAAALAAVGLLLIVLVLAPVLHPRVPEILYGDTPLAGTPADEEGDAPERIVIAPTRERDREAGGGHVPAPGAAGEPESALARLPAALQDQIRHRLWGEAWDQLEQAAAEAGAQDARETADGTHGGEEWEPVHSARRDPRGGRPVAEGDGPAGAGKGAATDAETEREDAQVVDPGGVGGSTAAAGAGNDTDPNLFGADTGLVTPAGVFELGIAARVRASHLAGDGSAEDAPPAARDRRPTLAPAQRREATAHRMPVPAAFEPLVRAVFAHRSAPP